MAPSGTAPSPASFYTVTPCRLVDTRTAAGPFGGPALAAGQTRSFDLPQAGCGVPADARAVALNVTAVGATAPGTLTLFPGTGAAPGTTTVVFRASTTRANNSVMGLAGGVLSVTSGATSGQVHLILDVAGYFR